MALIFLLSSQSGLRVSEDAAVDRPFRVSGHLLAFGTLAACLLFALARGGRPRPAHLVVAFAVTVLYGASDELHQSFVPERTGRLDDLVVDAAGALIGLAFGYLLLSRRSPEATTRRRSARR
jgi:VanZ family protein